ncbi:MAG: NAD-dependent epimerase/dehydratase family protein [Pseudomonadota bacterium]
MKVLVTGSAGFLGYYIARDLAKDADNMIVCVDNFVRGENDDLYQDLIAKPNVEQVVGDLNDQAFVSSLPDDVDIIFHMAALNGTQNFYERPFEVVRCCTLPTMFLLQKYGPLGRLKRWIYAGTSEAYASTVTRFGWEIPTAEDVPLGIDDIFNNRWSYGASKMHGEIATVNACQHFNVPFSIVRFHNAYGPRMGDKHVVPDFLMRTKNDVFELYGYEDTRSFIYADDASRATIGVAMSEACANQLVNIGSEDEITIHDLGKKMMIAAGKEGEIVLHPSPKGSVKRRAPNIAKLKELTGYEAEWTLSAGLKATAEFYLAD